MTIHFNFTIDIQNSLCVTENVRLLAAVSYNWAKPDTEENKPLRDRGW